METADSRGEAVMGLGVDLVLVPRFKKALDRWGERLTRRLFTAEELGYCLSRSRPEIHLAARFAAKEAFLKALGTGRYSFRNSPPSTKSIS